MKKYNQIIILSIAVYLFLALYCGFVFKDMVHERDRGYRVESNRIMNNIVNSAQINEFDLSEYNYIKKVEFLNYDNTDSIAVNDFYLELNDDQLQIIPFYQNDQLQGYVKFSYRLPALNIKNMLLTIESCLTILEIFIIIILWNIKKKIIQPFQRLKDLPSELSRGHFNSEVKEEKSKYFGRFMWGMSQLKDTLDISRKRQLELMKEKKMMLLSLSHDMKTPLNLIKLYSRALKEELYIDYKKRIYAMKQIEIKADEIEKYVDEIIKSSREDILDLQVINSEFYLQELLDRVLVIYHEQCALRQIKLIVHPYDNKLLKGDLQRSQEILENLFENAFKYGDGRRIELSFDEEDHCQLIRIFNTGEAVSDTEFNHLFESFYRGGNSQGQRGNGLGLYICRELMQKMGGTIFAEKDSEGMAFILVFQ